MDENRRASIRKVFLYALVASVALSALISIIAILSGDFSWVEIRILLTTITIVGGSICGLACGAYLATQRGDVLPVIGVVLTLLAATMIIAGIWAEPNSDAYWKFAATSAVFAVACAHLALLSLARLSEAFEWSLNAAYVAIFGVAALAAVMIVFEVRSDRMFQVLGVAAILDAAISILIPVFHRLSRPDRSIDGQGLSAHKEGDLDAEVAVLRERLSELEQLKGKE